MDSVKKLKRLAEEVPAFKERVRKTGGSTTEDERRWHSPIENFRQACDPALIIALCDLAGVMDATRVIAEHNEGWPGHLFLNGCDEGAIALDALTAIKQAAKEPPHDG